MTSAQPDLGLLPERERCLLVAQWVNTLSVAHFGTTGYGNSSPTRWQFQGPNNDQTFEIEIDPQSMSCTLTESVSGFKRAEIQAVISDATNRARNGDLGEAVCYQFRLNSPPLNIFGHSLQFMRTLGSQIAITGQRRLSDIAILNFSFAEPFTEPALFVPETYIDVSIFVPGEKHGPLSSHLASQWLEFVRLICSFAMGRTVVGSIGHAFPAKEEEEARARGDRSSTEILSLARKTVDLDPIALFQLGNRESIDRYRSALVAYEAALIQQNPDVSVVLLVSAIEALIAPTQPWRKERLVSRFQKAAEDFCRQTLDEILQHGNFSQAFGYTPRQPTRRQRLKLLDRIYDMRSGPVHSGPSMFVGGMLNMGDDPGQMRVALVADLAESMLLEFLKAPRSSLIGHPEIWPAAGGNAAIQTT